MLQVALAVLTLLCLIGGLLFNAELLNKAGADIPLKQLQTLEIYGQLLASASVCLFVWRLCVAAHKRRQRRAGPQGSDPRILWYSIALSTLITAPATWWVQGEVPDIIAEEFPASLRVYSLYAYVTKKGLLYDALQIPGVPYQEYRDAGEGKAFIANLGVLMSVQGSYVEKIDRNFQGFATAVFKGYTRRNADALYERLQVEVIPTLEDIIRAYARLEALRVSGVPGNERTPIEWPAQGQELSNAPSVSDYALSIKPGLRTRQAIADSPEVRYMARQTLGPLYVEGMDLFATREQFNRYLNGIAGNMAVDVAHTDIRGEQGLSVLKNMWFVPWSLLSGLFTGALNIVGLVLSLIERRRRVQNPRRAIKARLAAIATVIIIPIFAGNAILQSSGYRSAFRSIEKGPTLMVGVFHWAMSAEAMLYNLTKPVLKAQ